ncbi:MAG: MATE family efflux transporter, partial [Cyclobacteriaceae bacterium]
MKSKKNQIFGPVFKKSVSKYPYDREIWALAWPALGALAADPLVSLIDTAFVGQLGATQLGALGVNASIFSFTFWLFAFLAYGTTPAIARVISQGQPEKAGAIINQALVLALLSGSLALLVLQLVANPLIGLMGAQGELAEASLKYYRIRACSGPAVLVIMAGHGIFRGFQDTKTPFYLTLVLNLINLVLDPIFIFVLDWGLAGAAWATLIAQWFGAGAFLFLFLAKRRKELQVPIRWPGWLSLLPLLKVGSALIIRTLALAGTL